jgi:hypothetical protein
VLTDLLESHKRSSRHRAEVLASRECGCFYCLRTFPPDDIAEWIDGGGTALCPTCGIDAVIGSGSGCPVGDGGFLRRMHDFWFKPPVAGRHVAPKRP